ncbi:MAG: hypothetical protein E4H14_03225 [Candidatus Thorarchaeota archaeon]|nr:MAG: hypothetical protein E4H14_03225 [Candidatus Thorarchaeota archaeon]
MNTCVHECYFLYDICRKWLAPSDYLISICAVRLTLPCILSKVISMNDAIDLILSEFKSSKKEGLSIDDLAEILGIDKKQITLALTTLMSEGRIMQKQENEDKYMMKPIITDDSEPSGLTDMNGCPCFHCLRISKCGIRQPDSPADCNELEEWMGSDIR